MSNQLRKYRRQIEKRKGFLPPSKNRAGLSYGKWGRLLRGMLGNLGGKKEEDAGTANPD